MAILIRNGSESHVVSSGEFQTENDLELLLSEFPDLLMDEDDSEGPDIKFIDRQVALPKAGKLDLLFVDSEGLLIAVETKLARNAEARREVIAQVIDYLSALTLLTVDELNQLVNGKLKLALEALTSGNDDPDYDSLWKSVGANLRDGRARLVVALDEAPADLQRIFRFLARKSDLDVRLLSVQRYSSSSVGEVFVPQILVSPESSDRPLGRVATKEPHSELIAVVEAYNASAPQDIRAWGAASEYRRIRPADWPKNVMYMFRWAPGRIFVQLSTSHRAGPAPALALAEILLPLGGKPLVNGGASLSWDQDYHAGKGRLFAEFQSATPPETVAQAMRDLISMTSTAVTQKLKVLTDGTEAGTT
jgi:hypothetical protein